MKKFFALIILIIILFSGCRNGKDINERVIVQGIGIDSSDNGVTVTVQVLNTDTYSGIGGTKVPKELVVNYTLNGKTVGNALSTLSEKSGKEPLFTHTRVVVIGKGYLNKSIDGLLDFFSRDSSCRANLHLAVCKGQASELFTKTMQDENIPSVMIENVLKSSKFSSDTVDIRIYEFLKMTREKTTNPFLPVLELKSNESDYTVNITGTAVFGNNMFLSVMNREQTSYLKLLTNRINEGSYYFDDGKTKASFDCYKTKTDIKAETLETGKTVFNISVKLVLDNIEYISENDSFLDKNEIDELENSIGKSVSESLYSFIRESVSEKNVDCIRFGRVYILDNRLSVNETDKNWSGILNEAEYNVNVKVRIRRIGQEN